MWGWTLGLAVIACIVMMVWPKWRVEHPLASVGLHLAVAAPFVALASRFIVNDTDILHVALNGGEDLPLKYRFAATWACLLYTSPSPRDRSLSRMPSSA